MTLAIKAGKLIDGTGKAPLANAVILVEGTKITQVGPAHSVPIPPGARVISAANRTVMPGMVDAHVHVQGKGGSNRRASLIAEVQEMNETVTLQAYVNMRETLEAGFTTVRDLAARSYVAIALREAINSGMVEGPRMRACGQGLCITGGHMDATRWRPEVNIAGRTGVADSPWEFRQAARHQIKMGADCIKINACSGAHRNRHKPDEPFAQEMTLEEMKAVCDEAHKANLLVAAHTAGGQGITDAILAGVNSLEHAHWLTEEQVDLMAEHGTFCVPTLIVVAHQLAVGKEALGASDESWAWLNMAMEAKWRSLERARKAGVKIAAGTDAGFVVAHGQNAAEMELLVKAGLSPMEAIVAGTALSAECVDMADTVGTIEAGKFADFVFVDGDPLQDIRLLQRHECIKTVIKGGEVVVERS
ncbi:MAG: amidohydrolase family protein [Chloroflexi bacterium]|nr:amidohydrolase family protein [Chloroflexota bacterium]